MSMAAREVRNGQEIAKEIAKACSPYFFNSNCEPLKAQLAHSTRMVDICTLAAFGISCVPVVLFISTSIIVFCSKRRVRVIDAE